MPRTSTLRPAYKPSRGPAERAVWRGKGAYGGPRASLEWGRCARCTRCEAVPELTTHNYNELGRISVLQTAGVSELLASLSRGFLD